MFPHPAPLIYLELFGKYVVGGYQPSDGLVPAFAAPVLTPSDARSNAAVNERRRYYGAAGWCFGVV